MILLLLSLIVGVPLIVILLIVLGYTVAKQKKQASFVGQETIEFVVAGAEKSNTEEQNVPEGTLVETLVNTKGHRHYDRADPIPYTVIVGREKPGTGPTEEELKKFDANIKAAEDKLEEPGLTGEERSEQESLRDSLIELKSRRIFQTQYEPVKETVMVHHAIVPKDMLADLLKPDGFMQKQRGEAIALPDRDAKTAELARIDAQEAYIKELLAPDPKIESFKDWWQLRHAKVLKRWLQLRWGFFWVSLIYPARHILTFDVVHSRLKERPEGTRSDAREHLRDLVSRERPQPTQFLLRQSPRPVLAENIDFRDRFQGNVLLYAIFRVVQPYNPVFIFKEKFYQVIETALASAFIDYARQVGWVYFIKNIKTGPGSDFYLKALSQINVHTKTELGPDGKPKPGQLKGKGIVEAVGIELVDVWVYDYESKEEKDTLDALKADELARLKGEAEVTRQTKAGEALLAYATLQAEAVKRVGNMEAAVLVAKAKAGVQVAVAEQQVKGREALRDTKVTTIVESGANAQPLVSVNPPAQTPP